MTWVGLLTFFFFFELERFDHMCTCVLAHGAAAWVANLRWRRLSWPPVLDDCSPLPRSGSDIVPRLSVNSLAPYLATCRYVSTLRGWRRKLLEFGAQNVAVEWDELGELANAEERRAMADREHKQLFVPGIVLQLVRPKSVRHQDVKTLHLFAERKVDIIRVPRDHFVRIRHERGMLIMHAPHEYRKSLTGVLRSMGGAALKRTADTSGLLKSLTSVLPSTPDTEATVSGRRSLEAAAVLF